MQTRTNTKESHSAAAQPFFAQKPAHAPSFFSSQPFALQAQAQERPESAELAAAEHAALEHASDQAAANHVAEHAAAEHAAPVVQPKLTMGSPGDRFELEADAAADRVVQRFSSGDQLSHGSPAVQAKCTACQDEKKLQRQAEMGDESDLLQAKAPDSAPSVPDTVHQSLEGSRGGGQSLAPTLRDEMESAFDADFSGVRIHTGRSAESLNQDLSARAFTYGKDIYFNSGEFTPNTTPGRHLLAHELTHVVQQNSGVQRKSAPGSQRGRLTCAGGQKVQAALSFGPPVKMPAGTRVHSTILPMFVADTQNKNLFVEVKIPGANRLNVETGKVGVADFYKAKPFGDDTMARTIGINSDADGPSFLKPDTKLEGGGAAYSHNRDSAPRGGVHKPRVRAAGLGPEAIELGDLKPGNEAEAILGVGQLASYRSGIINTATDLRAYLTDPANAGQSDSSHIWDPKPADMASLKIPDTLTYPTGAGIYPERLIVYENGKKKVDYNTGMTGSMYVYKHPQSGIWAYEWLPHSIPPGPHSAPVDEVLERLHRDVIGPITATGTATLAGKLLPRGAANTVRRREGPKLQRKEKEFPYATWKDKYGNWKKDAESTLGTPDEKKKAAIAETLVDVDKRTGGKLNLPEDAKQRGLGYEKIRHWSRFGGLYGWLRNTFDGAYSKIKALALKIKKKVQALAKKVGSTSVGSWVKAAAKVIFKIFKMVGSWAVSQVVDKLIGSLHEGITNNLRKLVDAITPEGLKSRIEELEERKAQYEEVIKAKEEELETRLFGDKLALFEKLEEFEALAETASTIISVIEWGVRLLACASPPAIGCLWNLAISALQYLFAKLVQTCWFTQKVYAPVMNAIQPVRDFPATIAKWVVDKANDVIPLPAGMDPLFAPIILDQKEMQVECGDGDGGGGGGSPLTDEQRAIMEAVEEIGSEKFKAMLQLMIKRGAGPWVLLTAERLKELKSMLGDVTIEQLKAAAEQQDGSTPVPVEKFLEEVRKYSKQEQKLITEAAGRREAQAGKKDGSTSTADPGADSGGGGGSGGGSKSVRPLEKRPGTVINQVFPVFGAVTSLPHDLKPGDTLAKPIDVLLDILVNDGTNKGIAQVYPVQVKLQSVSDKQAVFVNQKTFYAFYFEQHFVEITKDQVITIPKDLLANVP